jgi:hypothetical protein
MLISEGLRELIEDEIVARIESADDTLSLNPCLTQSSYELRF